MLPRALCTCEIGFWPTHVEEDCKAGGHKKLELPYTCPIDHYLDPPALAESKVLTRTLTVTLALALALPLPLPLSLSLTLARLGRGRCSLEAAGGVQRPHRRERRRAG